MPSAQKADSLAPICRGTIHRRVGEAPQSRAPVRSDDERRNFVDCIWPHRSLRQFGACYGHQKPGL